jgi:hypothetical protein
MARDTRRGRKVAIAVTLVVSCGACGGRENRIAPTPSETPVPSAPVPPTAGTLAGTVIEFTATGDRRPVPNLRLKVRRASRSDGAVGGDDLPEVVTDANGRYAIADVSSPILFVATAPGSNHRFLCDYYPLLTSPSAPLLLRDLPVVHVSWSGDRLPPGMWSPGTSVHGTVSERVDGALRPVAGATVTLDTGLQDPAATTSASGFYMVCSVVGTDQYRTITARKDGYSPTSREIFGGSDFRIELELGRD